MKKLLPLILSTLLLTSCSGPDSSGGVEFSKTDNAFPYGDCRGPGYQTHSTEETGCGYFVNQNGYPENSYYIMPHALDMFRVYLGGANLGGAYLKHANLSHTNLSNADLSGATLTGSLSFADLSGATLQNANLSNANLSYTNLSNADLSGATLSGAWLRTATLTGVKANSSTICPNGKNWGTSGNDCGF